MEREQIFETQVKLTKIHMLTAIFVILVICERFTRNNMYLLLAGIAIMLFMIAFEYFCIRTNFANSMKLITCYRFLQIVLISYSAVQMNGTSMILYMFYVICFMLLHDLRDNYTYLSVAIISMVPIVVSLIYDTLSNYKSMSYVFRVIASTTILTILALGLLQIFIQLYDACEKKYFTQLRYNENANEINETLLLNQEKLKKANEQLGYQKIQLEEVYHQINNSNSEIMLQNQIVKYISSSIELSKLMSLITESILKELKLDICAIILNRNACNNDNVKYKIKTTLGENFNIRLGKLIEQEDCFENYVATKKPYIDNNVEFHKYPFLLDTSIIKSILIVPLIKANTQIGLLLIGHSSYQYFNDNISFFEAIVGQIYIALENANIYAKMQEMAIRDGLTGVYNRGYLTELFNEYLHDAILNKTPLSVALFDIDKFKKINDSYGHLFGDKVLKILADLANDIAKKHGGILGRFGGEEFVLVFPNKELSETIAIAEELHSQILMEEIEHHNDIVHIAVSIGITSYPETCKNPSELLTRADWAMYYSKQNGRGRIIIDSDEIRELVRMK